MIGIITAMQIEMEPFLKNGFICEEVFCGKKFFKLNENTVLTHCGVGKVNASFTSALLISRYNPDVIINCGVSGGISDGKNLPEVHILDLVLATACVQHDVDTSPLGDPKGFVSTVNMIEFPVDNELCEKISAKCHCIRGIIASGEQFVASEEKKKEISNYFNAIACDMESGALAQCAYIAGKKYVSLRCISDNGNGEAPEDFGAFCVEASEKLYGALQSILF